MKTELFKNAIKNRKRISFIYKMDYFTIEPCFIASDSSGKVLYGKMINCNEYKKFEYKNIYNIKVLDFKFSPVLPFFNYN